MTLEEMQLQQALVRREYDDMRWRHERVAGRLDAMALELDRLAIEIAVAKIRAEAPAHFAERRPLRMEIVEETVSCER